MELYRLKADCWATVTRIDLEGAMLQRVLDLGLTEGCRVMCVLPGYRGGPAAYLIRGAVIALRQRDALRVRVREEDGHGPA